MATVRTVMNESGSADTPDSLLWIINDIANNQNSVFINFDDSVNEIDISGLTPLLCDNLTISGLHSDGVTKVRIKNANTQPNALALFSMAGTPIAVKTVINLLNLEMIGDLTVTDPALKCKFFHISHVANVSIINCIFRDNAANNMLAKNQGGALNIQAPRDSLFVSSCTFSNNTAAAGGALYINSSSTSVIQIMSCDFIGNASTGVGGGLVIRGSSVVTMIFDASFTGNTAAGDGAGLHITRVTASVRRSIFEGNIAGRTGGALYSEAELMVLRSRFNQNTASGGGGLGCKSSSISMEVCALDGNISTGLDTSTVLSRCGGGMVCQDSTVQVCSTLFANNKAINGGAVTYQGDDADAAFTVCNCTLHSNSASETGGGFKCTDSLIPLTFTNCTIASNTAVTSGGGIESVAGVDLQLGNTLVASNTSPSDPDISGAVTTLGNNLVGTADVSNGLGGSDLTGTVGTPLDPVIGPLADNGGFALTCALLPLSLAAGAGNASLIPVGNPLFTYDQRGVSFNRISNGGVDIGAYSLQPSVICFRAGSHVLVKENSTGDIVTIDIALVHADTHTVYDTATDTYVPIIYNSVGKAREFYRLAPDLIDINVPDADLDMAGPHPIVQGDLTTQASDIDGAVRVLTAPELVYSICTETESVILINNTQVIAWDASQWDAYAGLNHISWVNN